MYYNKNKAVSAARSLLRDDDLLVRVLVVFNRWASNYTLKPIFDVDLVEGQIVHEIVEREEDVYA